MSNQSPEPSMTEPVSVAPAEVPAVPVEVPAGGVAEPKGLAAMTSNLKLIWENRNVRRLQLAFVGSEIGNWAYGMAILVWAYGKGGAVLVGTWAGIRMLLAAFSAPIGGAVADRVPRRTFMLANDAICLALILVTATMIWWDRNIWFVLVPATVLTVVQTAFRSAQAGLLPSLVDNPKQLTAANATSEIVNSGATFVGPAMAGLLLTVLGVVPVVLFNALSFIWSLYLVSRISTRAVTTESLADPSAGAASAVEHPGSETADDTVVAEKGDEVGGDEPAEEPFWKQTTRGFQAIGTDRDLLALTGLLGINGVLAGVLSVLVVLVAAQMLGDPAAVGWLNAVLGATTVLGGLVMLSLAGRVKLGRLVVWGVLGWCLPLIVLGIAPHIVVIVIVFAVIGLLDPMINVGFGVIPARLVEDRVLSRVYASIESLFVASAALGAFITPLLVAKVGLSTAVIVLGVIGIVLALLCSVRMPHLDGRLAEPRGLQLLSAVPLFAPLSPTMLEQLAHKLEPLSVPAGEVIVAEGGVSDLFYVIESGSVEVTQDGRVLRTEGRGDVFGEIGLLHDVPRTATVTALDDVELLTLTREDFLALMSGEDRVRVLASDLATRRLAI